MKKRLTDYIVCILLLSFISVTGWGQGKVYTRKHKIEDFSTSTTRVVLSGQSIMDLSLQKEISVRWRISPFEFCSYDDYEKSLASSNLYFLRFAQEGGIAFLVLSKGGNENSTNPLEKPLEIVRVPVSEAGRPNGREIALIGMFIDVIQGFVEQALVSDRIGYNGLNSFNIKNLNGRNIFLHPEFILKHINDQTPNTAVGLVIAPSEPGPKLSCYKLIVSSDTHELLYYNKSPFKDESDREFSDYEVKKIIARNGKVAR